MALLGDPAERAKRDRHFARDTFTIPALSHWPAQSSDQLAVERAVAADLRTASGTYSGSPRLKRLVRDLRRQSPTFERMWSSGTVGHHLEDTKVVHHPLVGGISVDCDVLQHAEGDLKTVCLTTVPGSDDESRYRVALVSGRTGWATAELVPTIRHCEDGAGADVRTA